MADINVARGEFERWQAKFFASKTDITLNNVTDTELANISFEGQLEGIAARFSRNTVEIAVEIDGIEEIRIEINDLDNTAEYRLKADGNFPRFPMLADNDGKQFVLNFPKPVDVLSNVTVKARITTTASTHMDAIMVVYRETVQ